LKNYVQIIESAKNQISDFCINTCKAKCCRFGQLLIITNEELDFIVGFKNVDAFLKNGILKHSENNDLFFTYDFKKFPCKHLNLTKYMCNEHQNINRPQICKDYPIFVIRKKFVIFSPACPAVEQGLLKECEIELEKIGMKIIN